MLLLQIHTATIAADGGFVEKTKFLAEAHRRGWEQLEDTMQFNMCLLGHFTHMQGT